LVVRDHDPVEATDATKELATADENALQQVITLEEKKKFAEGESALGRNV
jgi:hypothetical protein